MIELVLSIRKIVVATWIQNTWILFRQLIVLRNLAILVLGISESVIPRTTSALIYQPNCLSHTSSVCNELDHSTQFSLQNSG